MKNFISSTQLFWAVNLYSQQPSWYLLLDGSEALQIQQIENWTRAVPLPDKQTVSFPTFHVYLSIHSSIHPASPQAKKLWFIFDTSKTSVPHTKAPLITIDFNSWLWNSEVIH